MKRILITGANSYIGTSFKKWVLQYADQYHVDVISLKDSRWSERSFEGYDVLLHAAAIVHVEENDVSNYFKINRDLTIDVAIKARQEGIKQFIFLSTMGVYGVETGHISKETLPAPKTVYAQSKYEAEQCLTDLITKKFKVTILRPPIVYGKDCVGNYQRLAKIALKSPLFPNIHNERSMIYIDNLSEFIRQIIDHYADGLYFPQDNDYVNTTELVKFISKAHGKKMRVIKMLNWVITIGAKHSETIRKVFGSFTYDKTMPGGPNSFINGQRVASVSTSLEEMILCTEGR